MKNEILDDPIKQVLDDFLEKGETILWDDKPDQESLKGSFFLVFIFFSFPILFIFLYSYANGLLEIIFNTLYWLIIGIIILFSVILSINYSRQLKRKRVHYFITHKQILFQFKKIGKKEIHSIPFSKIKNFQTIEIDPFIDADFADKSNLLGSIFLSVKNPNLIAFETYDFRTGEKRAQPTLELINTKRATELIRQGIENAK